MARVLTKSSHQTYHDKRLAAWESRSQHFSVPPAIPKHLQTPQQRWEATTLMLPTMWIRTWFGNENVTRAEADAAYFKLCEHVDTEKSDFIDGNWAFEDDEEFMDVSGAPTTAGVTPKYVNALFRRYPDVVDPGGRPTERDRRLIEEGVLVGVQRILMIVADKIACETGAVLLIGINDFGGMLPKRLRVKPDDVSYFTATWENNGQDLDESFSEGDTGELVWYEGDDAWVPMLVLTDNKPTIQSITT